MTGTHATTQQSGGGPASATGPSDPMAPDRLSRYFRRLSEAAGLPPIRLHDLRHGAASLALAAGADLKVVQAMLGHSSIVLTADTYTSVLPQVAREAAEDIAALIITAGCQVPGTQRRRQVRNTLRRARAVLISGLSLAHPARQIGRQRHQETRRLAPWHNRLMAVPGRLAWLRSSCPASGSPWRDSTQCQDNAHQDSAHTLANLRPCRKPSTCFRRGEKPGQDGWGARGSNPEPTD